MPTLAVDDPKFARRISVLAESLDARIRVALETRRMIEQASDEGRYRAWFVYVIGTGHGHSRLGTRQLLEPPGCISADEKKASARSYR